MAQFKGAAKTQKSSFWGAKVIPQFGGSNKNSLNSQAHLELVTAKSKKT
jgi:hypothetical protein